MSNTHGNEFSRGSVRGREGGPINHDRSVSCSLSGYGQAECSEAPLHWTRTHFWEGSMIRFAGRLICLLLSLFSGPSLARSCIVPFIRTVDNQTVNGTMHVVSGKRCSIVLL